MTPSARPVLALAATGPCDPSFRVRAALLQQDLTRHGVTLELEPLFSLESAEQFRVGALPRRTTLLLEARREMRRRLSEARGQIDTVLIQRRVDLAPWLSLERMATADRRTVYDIDDAVWLSGSQTIGHAMSRLKGARRKVDWLVRRADHVIAGNEVLAEHMDVGSATVTVVPSLIDPSHYERRSHEQMDAVTLGWIGSRTTAVYLHRVRSILERFAKRCPRPVRLLVVGGSAPALSGLETRELAWSPQAERTCLAEMDIGLMPLPDTPWARGKCAYKALQYMACGIPAVVDDVGISARVVTGAGVVAGSEADWLDALIELAADPDLRRRLGARGRKRVEQDFSYARWTPVLAAILRGEPACR